MYLLLSVTYLWDLYRARYPLACWISIALVIHSLDPRWGLVHGALGVSIHLQDLYRTHYPFA
ncbi:MAG: hypothetical protein OXN17_07145 [Candidatus Poribacteria bacterium]|nr:hypothetical protein [Candidatus Poribacteria bacterium]